MRNHVLHILDKNSLGFLGFNHTKQLKEKVASVIFKTLAVTCNTKGLTRKASYNHIDCFRGDFLWQYCVNITAIQISILVSLSRILIKFIDIHNSELVGLFKVQLESTNTREERLIANFPQWRELQNLLCEQLLSRKRIVNFNGHSCTISKTFFLKSKSSVLSNSLYSINFLYISWVISLK